jgi:CubicO group peptidase (beta-lactamase class C family)
MTPRARRRPAGSRVAAVLAVALLWAGPARVDAQPAPLEGLADWVEAAMATWEIPALAVAVVADGEAVWLDGFGVRTVGSSEPVDENTVFAIGSASKAFTAAVLGMLVQEGRLDWDDRATRHLPGFETSDPWVTRELTVRDLLTHRSGLNRGDQVWYGTDLDRDAILRRVRHQPPSSSFRSEFGYNNNMFLAAGQLVPALTGTSWEDFVRKRIFAPLGMTRSTTSTLALERMENVARPHRLDDGEVRPIPWRNIDNIAPAGSINSTARDMSAWLRLQLAEGTWGGDSLIATPVLREMHSPQTIVPNEGQWARMAPGAHFLTYGMGWFLHDYRGRKVVEHGGNIDGMHALVGMMPEEEVGVAILTNLQPNALTYALMYRVFDAYLGGPATDWSARMKEEQDRALESGADEQRRAEESRVAGTEPSLALHAYAGTYRHAMYGNVEVAEEGGRLVVRRGVRTGPAEHWHYDTFRVRWEDEGGGTALITFHLDARARVRGADLQGIGELSRIENPG